MPFQVYKNVKAVGLSWVVRLVINVVDVLDDYLIGLVELHRCSKKQRHLGEDDYVRFIRLVDVDVVSVLADVAEN